MVVPSRVASSVGFGVVVLQSKRVINERVGLFIEAPSFLDLNNESSGGSIFLCFDKLPNFIDSLELLVNWEAHTHNKINRSHNSLVEIDRS